jgi:hypothetical protein
MNSGDVNGLRASERRHRVQHAYADRNFGRLRTDAALRIAVFAHCPFAFAVQLEAGAVEDQMQWLATAQGGQEYRQRLCAAAQGGIVGHRQISASMATASNTSDLQQQLHLVTDNSGYISLSTILGFSHGN